MIDNIPNNKKLCVNPDDLNTIQFGDQTLYVAPAFPGNTMRPGEYIGLGFQATDGEFHGVRVYVEDIVIIPFSDLVRLPIKDIKRTGYRNCSDLIENLAGIFNCYSFPDELPMRLIYFMPPDSAEILQNVREHIRNGLSHLVSEPLKKKNLLFAYTSQSAVSLDVFFDRILEMEDFRRVNKWLQEIAPHTESIMDAEKMQFSLPLPAHKIQERLNLLTEIRQRKFIDPHVGPMP